MTTRITDIRIRHFAIPLDPPFRASWDHQVRKRFSATVVEVHTDEGVVGYGSGDSMYGFEQFKHLFIGQEVSQIERHSDVLATLAFHYARYWPLEIALWDVLGKVANLPLFRLWGGIPIACRPTARPVNCTHRPNVWKRCSGFGNRGSER
jgi:L-alanine-DL-glutamate epimerase-like enolase superfamily enzyme